MFNGGEALIVIKGVKGSYSDSEGIGFFDLFHGHFASDNIFQLSDLFVHGLIDVFAGDVIDFYLSDEFNRLIDFFLYSPDAVLDFTPAAGGFVRAVFCGGDGFIDEVGDSFFFDFGSEVDVIDFIAVFVDIDLMIELGVFFGYFSYHGYVAQAFFPKVEVFMLVEFVE